MATADAPSGLIKSSSKRFVRVSPRRRCVAEAVESRLLLSASLVKDINTVEAFSNPGNLIDYNGLALFSATDVAHGAALWRSDGTAAGTSLVKAVDPVAMTNVDGQAYFAVNGDSPDAGLWTTDGTAAGTTQLLAFDQLPVVISQSQYFANTDEIGKVGSSILFTANLQGGLALWATDGTPAGTQLVQGNIIGSSDRYTDPEFQVLGDRAVFFESIAGGAALYTTDGRAAGTTLLKKTLLDSGESPSLSLVNGRVYFSDFETGKSQLWSTDGTPGGTSRTTDGSVALRNWQQRPVAFGGSAFFEGTDATGPGLWKTDGTPAGTVLVTRSAGDLLTASGGFLYFRGYPATLYRTDGTAAGTVSLATLSQPGALIDGLADASGTLLFSADDSSGHSQLWKSDGTVSGTGLLRLIDGGVFLDSTVSTTVSVQGVGLFSAGGQLWKSDGTDAGTSLVTPINPATQSSRPGDGIDINGELFFTADDGVHGPQVWKTDGTDAGTVMVSTAQSPASSVRVPLDLTDVNGTLYFAVEDSTNPANATYTIYQSDGTPSGTVLLKDLQESAIDENFHYPDPDLTAVGGTLYFRQFTGSDWQIWRASPSAAAPTKMTSLSDEPLLSAFGDKLMVRSRNSSGQSYVLQGQTLVTLARTGEAGAVLGGLYYYLAWPDGSSVQDSPVLYRTDGTPAGTEAVEQIPVAPGQFMYPTPVYSVGGMLLFAPSSETSGPVPVGGLWASDGTAAGTRQLFPGLELVTAPVAWGGAVYLIAGNPAQGAGQLWKTDGTAAGTVLLKDHVGSPDGNVQLAVLDGELYFTASDPASPWWQFLWQTDGTPAGTQIVPGIPTNPVPTVSFLTSILGVSAGKLYFSAPDPLHGNEPWALQNPPPSGGGSGNGGSGGNDGNANSPPGGSVGTGNGASTGNTSPPTQLPPGQLLAAFLNSPGASVRGGDAGSLRLRITNAGSTDFNGPVSVTLCASADRTAGSDDPTLAAISLPALKLKAGAHKTVVLRFNYPTGMPAGSDYVIASVQEAAAAVAPASAVAASVAHIAAASVDLSTSFNTSRPIRLKAGRPAVVAVTVKNLGNVTASGTLDLSLYASPDATIDPFSELLATIVARPIRIRAGKSATFRVKFAAPTDLSPGSYHLIATAAPSTTPADGNRTNDQSSAATW